MRWLAASPHDPAPCLFSDADLSALTLKHLRFAVAAATYGSIRQAAEAMTVRQSTLSRSIKEFERSIGVAVFERSSGGVEPTTAGHSVLQMARTVLGECEALVTTAKSVSKGQSGRLVLGFSTSLSAGNLRASIMGLKQQFPEIELVTVERSRMGLATALRNGALDVLITTGKMLWPNNKSLPLWSERILVALPDDHPLTSHEIVYWENLRDHTVLLSQYDPGREFEDVLISKLLLASDRPNIERHDVSRGAIKDLIRMKAGISLMLESDIDINPSGLTYRELHDGAGPSHIGFSAIWREDNENPTLASFLGLLTERHPLPLAS